MDDNRPAIPERSTMTVCIAAIAGRPNDCTIVCCSDSLMSGALGSADNKLKNRPMPGGWGILTAGSDFEIAAVYNLMRAEFGAAKLANRRFDAAAVLEIVRTALVKRKLEKANELIQGQYGISYDELRKSGGTQFPPDLFREAMWAVRDCSINGEFIIYGFTSVGAPLLIQTTQDGKAKIQDEFAVIGSGGYLAHSVLMHREHHGYLSNDQAVYSVYEAKRYAEGDRSVGANTTIITAKQDGGRYIFYGHKWAQAQYKKLGPRSFGNTKFDIPDGSWTELSSEKQAARDDAAKEEAAAGGGTTLVVPSLPGVPGNKASTAEDA